MKKNSFVTLLLLLLLSACSSQPVPLWKDTASRQREYYVTNFLSGSEDATEPHLDKAKKAAASNNNLSLLGMLYLTKYALHMACLEPFDDKDFLLINQLQPSSTSRAYYDFLKGNFTAINPRQLPDSYSKLLPLLAGPDLAACDRAIAAIDDPLSRLIACGVRLKYLPGGESVLQLAIDTSAEQGWRRPLLAYLTALHKYYSAHQETGKAENIKKRLELLQQ